MLSHQTVEFWRDPRMPYVETRRACQSRICYKSHSHPTFSIGAVDAGQSRFSSFFSENQYIEAGCLVVIPAYVEHSCNPMPDEAWSYQMMHLDAEWLTSLLKESCLINKFDSLNLDTPLPQLKPMIFKNRDLYQSFTRLNRMLFDPEVDILEKEQTLVQVLSEILLPNFDLEKSVNLKHYQQQLPHLIKYLNAEENQFSLQQLSEKFELSRYALIRLFKYHLGQTPHAYQLNHKINTARNILGKGEQSDLAQLAYELDFTDQSHFHRVFKQHTGVTPKQYYKKSS